MVSFPVKGCGFGKKARYAVLLIVPLFCAFLAYRSSVGTTAPPMPSRVVHPPPPSYFKAYGKRVDPSTLENPFRPFEKKDPESFAGLVKERHYKKDGVARELHIRIFGERA